LSDSLRAYLQGEVVFRSSGRWLYPLFELEEFLHQHNFDRSQLLIEDKIVGRAAALIMVHLGIRLVKINLLSRPGQEVVVQHNIHYTYAHLVDRIDCKTEERFRKAGNAEAVYLEIKKQITKNGRENSSAPANQ